MAATPLDVGKVLLGAFLVPWWGRGAFARALAIPLLLLGGLTLGWYFASGSLPLLLPWLFLGAYGVFFTLYAVTCHRLVLLDPQAVAARLAPRWSWRETRFLCWLTGIWLLAAFVFVAIATLLLNASQPWVQEPGDSARRWLAFAAKVPAFYVFARLCPIFPAAALDRRVGLRWAWRLTRGNGWRLFLIVAVLPWILSELVGVLYRDDASALETVMLTFLACLLLAVEIAAVSLSYREFASRDPGSIEKAD